MFTLAVDFRFCRDLPPDEDHHEQPDPAGLGSNADVYPAVFHGRQQAAGLFRPDAWLIEPATQ